MNNDQEGAVYTLIVPGEVTSLSLVRRMLIHLSEMAGFPEEDIGQIEIAVDEACTNVIEHGYRVVQPKPPVRVEVRFNEEKLVVDIVDEGAPFNFEKHIMPVFPDHWDQGHTRGVGLFIIKECMDESSYTQLPDQKNRLRLVKRRHHQLPAG